MDKAARRQRIKRIVGAIAGVIVTVLMAILFRPEGLGEQGCFVLAILAGAIVWWICAVLPEFATALIMVALFALIGQIPATSGFSFFSNPIWWLLVGAFSIGLGMKETGLLERMALAIVSPLSLVIHRSGHRLFRLRNDSRSAPSRPWPPRPRCSRR